MGEQAPAEEFRDGNVPEAGAVEVLRRCQVEMSQGKGIGYYRADRAYYQAGVIDHCFSQGILSPLRLTSIVR